MQKIAPADELADIGTELRRLEARAAALRTLILAHPAAAEGRWHRAVTDEMRTMTFDADLLPQAVRDDPHYWRERITTTLRCEPVAGGRAPLRSGWPIQREATTRLH